MEVKELMNPSVVTIEPTASAALAARLISRHNVGALPVCGRTGGCAGWSQTGILYCGVAAEEDPAQTLVRDIMTRAARRSPQDDCREATRLMSVQQVRRLPVVEDGRLVGIVSLADLARSQRFDMEAAQALGRSRKYHPPPLLRAGQRPGETDELAEQLIPALAQLVKQLQHSKRPGIPGPAAQEGEAQGGEQGTPAQAVRSRDSRRVPPRPSSSRRVETDWK